MKKVNLNGKLSLKKETIAKLNDEQMKVIKGGTNTNTTGCNPCHASCINCLQPPTKICSGGCTQN